jgi:hypothetical protein
VATDLARLRLRLRPCDDEEQAQQIPARENGNFDPPISPGQQNGLIIFVPTLKSGDTISADIYATGRRMHVVVTVP